MTPTQRVSAGLLKPDDGGRIFGVFDVPAGLDNISAAAITVEPEGGSTQPTTQAFLHGQH